jgi:hypothetical protein
MNKNVIIALVKAIISNEIRDNPSLRGKRGLKGRPGDPFSFKEHKDDLNLLVSNYIDSIKDQLTPEITQKQLKELRLKFDDLTEEEKLELKGDKGVRGQRGKDGRPGKDFIFGEHKIEIEKIVSELIDLEELKLKFDDLTDEEKESLRGPKGRTGKAGRDGNDFQLEDHKSKIDEYIKIAKIGFLQEEKEEFRGPRGLRGQRGKSGNDFQFDDHCEEIEKIITDHINTEKDQFKLKFTDLNDSEVESLKLKFEDLTIDEKESLRGQRGSRGQKGKEGKKGEKGEKGSDGRDGIHGLDGLNGRDGLDGIDGKDGSHGRNAPIIEKVEIEDYPGKKYRFKFTFSNGDVIYSNPFELPEKKKLISQIVQSFSSGGGSGGGGRTPKLVYNVNTLEEYDTPAEAIAELNDYETLVGRSGNNPSLDWDFTGTNLSNITIVGFGSSQNANSLFGQLLLDNTCTDFEIQNIDFAPSNAVAYVDTGSDGTVFENVQMFDSGSGNTCVDISGNTSGSAPRFKNCRLLEDVRLKGTDLLDFAFFENCEIRDLYCENLMAAFVKRCEITSSFQQTSNGIVDMNDTVAAYISSTGTNFGFDTFVLNNVFVRDATGVAGQIQKTGNSRYRFLNVQYNILTSTVSGTDNSEAYASNFATHFRGDTLANISAYDTVGGWVSYGTDTNAYYGSNGTILKRFLQALEAQVVEDQIPFYSPDGCLESSADFTFSGTSLDMGVIIDMGGNQIKNLADPTDDQDAVTKKFFDDNNCLEVQEDDLVVDTCIDTLNFKGDLVTVVLSNSMSQWATLSDVEPSIADYLTGGKVDVCIDAYGNANYIASYDGSGKLDPGILAKFVGDTFTIERGAEFNEDFGEHDFVINRNTSGRAYHYDSSIDEHLFRGLDFKIYDDNNTLAFQFDADLGRFILGPDIDYNGSRLLVDNELHVSNYIRHDGNTGNYIRFVTNQQVFQVGSLPLLDLVGGATPFAVFNSGNQDVDFQIRKNGGGNAYEYNAGLSTHTLDGDTNIDGVLTQRSSNGTVFRALSTGSIDTDQYTSVRINNSGISLTLLNASDGKRLRVHNASGGDVTMIGTYEGEVDPIIKDRETWDMEFHSVENEWTI